MTGALAGAAALAALLELDDVHIAQIMVSRPIVLGPLLGLCLGQPAAGLALGAAYELLGLNDLPMGERMPLNGSVAAAAAILLSAGDRALAPELAFPAGLAAGWTHRRLESALRQRRRNLCGSAEKRVLRGDAPGLGGLAARALAGQAAATFAFFLAVLLAGGPLLSWFWAHAPRAVERGLGFSWAMAPWLGLGVLLHALRAVSWRG
ncbi:MAG: PTS sugar transporter subunit IIC [Elusimicrobia bacterium]|nr:PTS sugar transporter subunit IIC [Elusimicrobiota bacterium]